MIVKRFCIYQKYAILEFFWLMGLCIHEDKAMKHLCTSTGSVIFFFLPLPSNLMWMDKRILSPPPLFADFWCFKKSWSLHDVFCFWHFTASAPLSFLQLNNHRKTSLQIEHWISESLLQIPRVEWLTQLINKIVSQAIPLGSAFPTLLNTVLLIISSGTCIKANNNGEVKNRSLVTCVK